MKTHFFLMCQLLAPTDSHQKTPSSARSLTNRMLLLALQFAIGISAAANCSWLSVNGGSRQFAVVGRCNGRPVMLRSTDDGVGYYFVDAMSNLGPSFEPTGVAVTDESTVVTGVIPGSGAIAYGVSAFADGTECTGMGYTRCNMVFSSCYTDAQGNATLECDCTTEFNTCLGSCGIRVSSMTNCNNTYNYYDRTCDCGYTSKCVWSLLCGD
jgi:hypothetical protein